MSVKPVNGQCPEGYVPVVGNDGEIKGCMPVRQRSVFIRDGEIIGDREGMRSADYFAHKIIDRFYPDSQNKKQLHYQIMGSFSKQETNDVFKDIYNFAQDDKNLYDASDALGNEEKEKELVDLFNNYRQIYNNEGRGAARKFLVDNGASKVLAGKFIEDTKGDLKDVDDLITTLKQVKLIENDQLMSLVNPDRARDTIKYIEDIANRFGTKIGDPEFNAKNFSSLHRNNLKPLRVNELFYKNDDTEEGQNNEIYASKEDINYVYGPEGTPDRVKYDPEVRRPKRPTSFTGITGQVPQWKQRGSETEFDVYDVFPTGASSVGGGGSGSAMDERNPTRKDTREAKRLTELDNKNVPANNMPTPPPQPVIPPTTPQGQVEFMQQQAQQMPVPNEVSSRTQFPQMPVPNEVSSRTQFPQMTGGIPEAEQQVGMQEEVPQDNGSIFQRLRNLFSGKSPQPPQPNVAPQVTPQTTPQQPVDNRVMGGGARGGNAMNEMMPKEFQNAQNLGQQVTQPGMFGGGVGDGSSMGQSATTGLSGAFATAGESPVGTTGTVTGATNVNTGALPQSVVDNATQTQTTIPTETGTGTQPPSLATPGIVGGGNTFSPQFIAGGGGSPYVSVLGDQIVTTTDEKGQKSKSIQDLIEIGGTGFDDEVLARKLRRQAGMPELKNEDYYPNQPFTQAQTAWGDPIFSGAGALFPMAAYDAQRKARAQAEIDEAKRNVMQIKIPEIKTGAYVEMVKSGFTNDVTNLTNEYVKKYGGPKKAIQAMRQDGSLANLQARWEGVAKSIDQTADRAKEFLKNAQEKSTTMYFSPEGVRAATNFMNGMDAFSKGEITPDQLNQLEQQFRTAERWDDYKERNMKLLTADEKIPTAEQMNAQPSQEDMASFQEQLKLPGATQDYQTWIFVKKYSDLNKQKVLDGIVLPFFSQNPTAMEQLANENETPEQTANRIADSIVALRGRQIEVGQREKNPSARTNNIFNFNPTGGKEGMGFHESTLLSESQIRENLNKNRQNKSLTNEQLIDQSFGGSWRARPNDPYVRASVPGQIYDATTTPLRYSDYLQPTGISGQGSPDRQWNTIIKKDLDLIGAKSTAETPKFAKIVGVEMSWAVRDPKTNQWNMVTADNLKKYGMPPNAKMVIIEQNLLYNEPSEGVSTTMETPDGSKITTPAGTEKGPRKAIKAVRVLEATPENVRFYDNITNRETSNEGAYGVPKSGTATTPSTGQNISLK